MAQIPKNSLLFFVANQLHFLNHYYLHLLQYFKSEGFRIGIIVPFPEGNNNGDLGKEFTIHYLPYFHPYRGEGFKQFKMLSALRKIIRQCRPVAIFTFTFKISIATAIAGWSLNIPIFPTFTGLGFSFMHRKLRADCSGYLCKVVFRKCPRVIFQNEADYEYFLRKKWLPDKHMGLIGGSGLDLTYYRPIPYPALNKIRVLLYVGRIHADKGLPCLINSLGILKRAGIPFKCLLAGQIHGGHPTDIPMIKIKDWERQGLITFTGYHKDIRPLLRQTNVLIQPSKREGLSRSILEALACGRPVISSNAPGCAALIEEGENGWLFSTDNEKELTQVIQKVLQIPYDTLLSMSQRTKDSISSTYLNRAIHGYYSKIVMSQIL